MTDTRSHIPSSTYRLQFNKHFTFRQARDLVPYLRDLGVSHVYASPFFRAGPGSLHGYDIGDHNELNPEIGTRAEYDEFVSALHAHGMGQIVDFVPNHMGIGSPVNTWWTDVLENGPSSEFAPHFDIDWRPLKSDLNNCVLLPILGDQYGRVLERGEFKLEFESGAFFLRYFDTRLPLAPRTYTLILVPALVKLASMGVADDFLAEFQSVITALEHLPPRTETDPDKIAERLREKEIIKRRLLRRCDECPELIEAITAIMREIEGQPGDARSFDAFDELITAQAYRLSFWRVAAEEINYRRFFDINELAAIRVELPEVFEATHRLLLELIASGSLDGVRIDHVDGLWNPAEYLSLLQSRAGQFSPGKGDDMPLYLVVEKILLGEERLRPDWPVHGTTGYEFANQAIRLLIDPAAEKSVTETYAKFIGSSTSFSEIAYHRKQLVMRLALASEINVLAFMLDRLSERNRWYRDFTLNALTTAVREVIACFPVYRTYLTPNQEPGADDIHAVRRAVRLAERRNPGIERSMFDFLGEILIKKFPENIDEQTRAEHMHFVMKFQQCTGPIMAKGVEDTSFYIYNRLVALNEVGGEPNHFAVSPEKFFGECVTRLREHPHCMLATSTHDTKRSEDVRARIATLSELPSEWRKALRRWQTINRRHKREIEGDLAPDANEEYLIYQTLLGSWPLAPMDKPERATYLGRIQEYIIKAIKEAKVNSSWVQPNDEWENAVRDFLAKLLRAGANRFLDNFKLLADRVAQLGMVNSLAQTVLKAAVPGMPDFYQGTELWDFSLVDPDNRRLVDYEARRVALSSLAGAEPSVLLSEWRDGRIKLHLTHKLLHFRRDHPALFMQGGFTSLTATGAFGDSCIAFLRRFEDHALLLIVPRLSARLGFPPVGGVWRDTVVEWPEALHGRQMRDLFTGVEYTAGTSPLALADALRVLPFAAFALV
ncbi:MAG: malto-oligosyltrehalose synthase [Prosthecobacter sp.]|uniref:malto-oligosyltrehalose synthase n=1 Tax=Prosthecobacter sp. TaxID=1965333 RepID=UPI0026274989|nr:malto-oligosyltrehalose synthase [Prosthecobacter sp.]MCF7789835.1 malto-oligosyltrehalose synthase [Prosthecobacter sp.]